MWHGLASGDHPKQQQQRQQQPREKASPRGAQEKEQKWWHVPDGHIEEMIRRLNTPEESMAKGSRGKKPMASALRRTQSVGTPFNRSVQFSKGMLEQGSPAETEGSPNTALQQTPTAAESAEEATKKKKGAWKVPDAQLLEWIQKTQTALAMDNFVEEASGGRQSSPHLGNTMLGKLGGSVSTSSLGYHRQAALGQCDAGKRNIMGYSRSSRHKCKDLSSRPGWSNLGRPEWSNDRSNPNLFAKVGSGLDGKGNKWISEFQKFAEQPIFLSDRHNSSFENVRVAVCGHPAYMNR